MEGEIVNVNVKKKAWVFVYGCVWMYFWLMCVQRWVNEWINEWTSKWANDRMVELMSKWMKN